MLKRFALLLGFAALLILSVPALAQWHSMGPYGGNARALTYDPANPDHILLGSGAGALFESNDGGRHWRHFAHLGIGSDLMLENIAFDPTRPSIIYVGGWSVTGSGGGFFVSRNGGLSWGEPAGLRGKSIQAIALADSVPGTLIAGALDGLYRSTDWGATWVRITPMGHPDLKNFESVAVDPRDARTIYAGTWHLPWKTTDGGAHWKVIKQGVIDDSDVFSIILDHSDPQTVFASACSGIYKSENGGELFHKVQGIPGTARRTRVLQQDPRESQTVYAGTTEGLWKTTDGGGGFKLISPPNYILNDVLVDPRNSQRVLIATDRGGVFASDDAGTTFHPSNDGFSQRQITALVADSEHHSDLYAAVLNDKEFGGVFRLHNGSWLQLNEGLGAADVFDLAQAPGGALLAAANRGLFLFDPASQHWTLSRELVSEKPVPSRKPIRGKNGKMITLKPLAPVITRSHFEGRAVALTLGHYWYAATDSGLLISANQGKNWSGGAIDGQRDFASIASHGEAVVAASLRGVWYSSDEGAHWSQQTLPNWVSRIYSVAIGSDGAVWIGTREGALRRKPGSATWEHVLNGLASREITWIRADGDLLMAISAGSENLYTSRDQGQQWTAETGSGFEIVGAVRQGDALYLATRHHGLLAREPLAALSAGQR